MDDDLNVHDDLRAVVNFNVYSSAKVKITFRNGDANTIKITQGERFVTLDNDDLELIFESYTQYKKTTGDLASV